MTITAEVLHQILAVIPGKCIIFGTQRGISLFLKVRDTFNTEFNYSHKKGVRLKIG